jgi:K+-transporting ATPase KdpF subunit
MGTRRIPVVCRKARLPGFKPVWQSGRLIITCIAGPPESLQLLYTCAIHLYTVLIPHSLPCIRILEISGRRNGLAISIVDPGLFWPERVADVRHRKTGEFVMTYFYIVGAVAALLLMVYLVVALLKPELFS